MIAEEIPAAEAHPHLQSPHHQREPNGDRLAGRVIVSAGMWIAAAVA
jgi:hypothetical protein